MAVLLRATGLAFVLTSSGPAGGLGAKTLATLLAPGDSKYYATKATGPSDNSNHTKWQLVLRSCLTDATPREVGLHCVRPVTNFSVRYLHHPKTPLRSVTTVRSLATSGPTANNPPPPTACDVGGRPHAQRLPRERECIFNSGMLQLSAGRRGESTSRQLPRL
jgi:hypothetical protein